MKLILSLTLTWILFSTAEALQCVTCTDTTCSSSFVSTCPSETMCVAAAIQASASGSIFQQYFKTCAPASVCSASGSQTFAVNTMSLSALASVQCCNTDNCNNAIPSLPAAPTVNSLQCYSCDYLNSNCSTKIQCTGVEDRCFRASATIGSSTSLTLGCASANLCAAASSSTNLPLVQGVANITCCGSNLCNAAPTTATATVCLLLGLLVFSLY